MDAAAEQRWRAGGDHSLAAVILGNDALVAARPCTPAQLANACLAAGFDLVVPPAWGDELVATAYLERLAERQEPVIVACACPRVNALMAEIGSTLPQLSLAAPPVAVARALRAVHGESILITYVGDCPSGSDASIDVRFSPAALFAQLDRQDVKIADQPTEFVDAHEDRWRRYASGAGGLPALRFLARSPVDRVLRTLDAPSLARGDMTPSRSNVLVDLAAAAGCACGGARDTIEEGEPRRRTTPVVQCPQGLPLSAEPTPPRRRVISLRGPSRAVASAVTEHVVASGGSDAESVDPVPAEQAPVNSERPPLDTASMASEPTQATPGPSSDGGASAAAALIAASSAPSSAPPRGRLLAAVPAIVIVLVGALGALVYATGASGARSGERDSSRTRSAPMATSAGELSRPGVSVLPRGSSDSGPGADTSAVGRPARPSSDSATRAVADSIARIDSVRAARRRVRRAPAPDVVPGWMPQGRPAFVPSDSGAAGRDSSGNVPRRDSTRRAPSRPDSTSPPA